MSVDYCLTLLILNLAPFFLKVRYLPSRFSGRVSLPSFLFVVHGDQFARKSFMKEPT